MTRASRGDPARPGRNGPGFTLLEVMVALAVLAAAMMAIADLGGGALRNFGFARDLSGATLLARGKMAELEERYEDQGFRDFDEITEGDFAEEGAPGVRWKAEILKPASDLSAEQLLAVFLGSSPDDPDTQQMLAKLLGGAVAGGQAPGGPTQASGGAPGGLLGGVMQAQMTAFAEVLKKSLREMRLTVTWRDGKKDQGFTVTTHLVVLNPRAPGGARGPNPDIPPNLGAPAQAGQAAGALPAPPGIPGAPGMPGLAPGSLRPARRTLPQEDGSPPVVRRRPGASQGGE